MEFRFEFSQVNDWCKRLFGDNDNTLCKHIAWNKHLRQIFRMFFFYIKKNFGGRTWFTLGGIKQI